MDDFTKTHKDLDVINNLIQLSMDGPHVNLSFHNSVEAFRKEENPNASPLFVAVVYM